MVDVVVLLVLVPLHVVRGRWYLGVALLSYVAGRLYLVVGVWPVAVGLLAVIFRPRSLAFGIWSMAFECQPLFVCVQSLVVSLRVLVVGPW